MKPTVKISLIISGYVLAFLVAWAVVAVYISATSGPDRQDYGGMYAFGDALLFLGVLGMASVPATGAALYFLRPYRTFWRALSVAALAIATTAVAALMSYFAARAGDSSSALGGWADYAILRILVAPLFALGFFISALFAPARPYRITLLLATAAETAAFACLGLIWFGQLMAN